MSASRPKFTLNQPDTWRGVSKEMRTAQKAFADLVAQFNGVVPREQRLLRLTNCPRKRAEQTRMIQKHLGLDGK